MQTPSAALADPSQADEELARVEDDYDDPADDTPAEKHQRLIPSMRFLAGMAALGIALALSWRYSGLEEWAFAPAAVTAQAAPAAAAAPEGELARTMREVEALKKTITELITANHQMTATITALQAGQQDLQRRAAGVQSNGWHADAATMRYRIVAQPKSATSSVTPRPAPPSAPARAEVRSAPKPSDQAPLQLTSPRP